MSIVSSSGDDIEKKTVASIIDDASEIVKESGLSGVIRRIVIAGPLAAIGFAIAYGIRALENLYTGIITTITTTTEGLATNFFGNSEGTTGLTSILAAGADATSSAISGEWGIAGWAVSIGIVMGTLWAASEFYDRMDVDTLSGIDIPILSRYMGDEEN